MLSSEFCIDLKVFRIFDCVWLPHVEVYGLPSTNTKLKYQNRISALSSPRISFLRCKPTFNKAPVTKGLCDAVKKGEPLASPTVVESCCVIYPGSRVRSPRARLSSPIKRPTGRYTQSTLAPPSVKPAFDAVHGRPTAMSESGFGNT